MYYIKIISSYSKIASVAFVKILGINTKICNSGERGAINSHIFGEEYSGQSTPRVPVSEHDVSSVFHFVSSASIDTGLHTYMKDGMKKNIPKILNKLRELVDSELKTHRAKFCAPSSRGAMLPISLLNKS